MLQFLPGLKQKINFMLPDPKQTDKYFKYLSKFDFKFEMILGYESGDTILLMKKNQR
jgi:hypothetical protein